MPIRITGMNSGLDTESIVTALVSGYKTKKDNLVKAQTKQSWKMDAWKEVNSKVYSLYTGLDKMRLSSANYKVKKTSVSDTTKASVSASSSAVNGTQTLKISQLAKAGYLTGAKLASGTTSSTTMADLSDGFSSGTITVNTADGATDIDLTGSTKISDVVSKLKDAGVNASYDENNRRFFISAKEAGADNDFSITASDAGGLSAMSALGINVESEANISTYKAYADYAMSDQVDDEENALPLYEADEDGNYSIVEGRSYDETATRNNLTTVFNGLRTAENTVADKTTENATLNREIVYANAASANAEAMSGVSDSVKNKINGLLSTSATYASVDGSGNVTEYTGRTENDDNTYTYTYTDENGNEKTVTKEEDYTVSTQLTDLAEEAELITKSTDAEGNETTDESAWTTYKANQSKITAFETAAEGDSEAQAFITKVGEAIAGTSGETVSDITTELGETIASNVTDIEEANDYIDANSTWYTEGIGDLDNDAIASRVEDALDKITVAMSGLAGGIDASDGARRVDGQDAMITLNGAEFTSSSNKFEINGLTINATATTGDDEITITTATDAQSTYDKIKDFLTEYNEVMNSLSTSYNAASSKGYEPLTEDQKAEMSDTEVEKWEAKIKDSLLRRDQTLSSIMSTISDSMSKTYSVTMADGTTQKMSLASLGIKTGGYFTTAANDRYAYHIDGDEDDSLVSGNEDKLMAMIESDPDAVESLMKQVTQGLYDKLDAKMKSSTISSSYTIYNDKQMATEYSNYTSQISTWETRLSDMEERYYKQFAAMESALSTLNSNSSSLGSMLG